MCYDSFDMLHVIITNVLYITDEFTYVIDINWSIHSVILRVWLVNAVWHDMSWQNANYILYKYISIIIAYHITLISIIYKFMYI